ncbi:sigma-70 family RNA polymerase sigma factor [Hwanghaeella grinnelliae]|uniref:Sigma-70 family RNA polymerase sigma factor n=1 Tax=Hwanghaeella grinnelliae TaxID=2500179 RepID=A0A437QYG6_9PROT|nr:RNA polymerase sigma factor SigJ [Hwanghaeella grinnelliae]RVU39542.1 sigma-70 family RNA polymerase sigma factor [Hwanghaeella grinnelliae]
MQPDIVTPNREAAFATERGRLIGLAYRMLGTRADAEDVVQDAWLRWRKVPVMDVENPAGYLSTIVTRLCLDRLKQARRRRELYVGPWLPEPVLTDPSYAPPSMETLDRDVSFALMTALERLSPLERAAFILHDIFETPFPEIAVLLDRSEAACRQLASRARGNIANNRARFEAEAGSADKLADAFFAAARDGDTDLLKRVLAHDAQLHTDGGGRKAAALNVIKSADKITRFFAGLARKPAIGPPILTRRALVNDLPALLTLEHDGTRQAAMVEIVDGQIRTVYMIRNPEKLERLWADTNLGDVEFS